MRTAESYLEKLLSQKTMSGSRSIPIITIDECLLLINQARKEALEEAADKVGRYSYDMGKTEIFKLINELK